MADTCPITILSFCAECGVLLPEGMGREEDPECVNCGRILTDRSNRIEGTFPQSEAEKLKKINFGGI
ncbi:hypothetical protein LCGC14_2872310 [marine sediment metagenome]|uniref:Uncharacterized protein n=1 Tax=marine sediment metagenome TaxID=412755 RepID=A0A0F8Y2R8_9ZZZZ